MHEKALLCQCHTVSECWFAGRDHLAGSWGYVCSLGTAMFQTRGDRCFAFHVYKQLVGVCRA